MVCPHLVAGLLIPFIYYLGLHYSNGLITRTRGLILLGAVTTFLWIVELLRYISPSFRGHYNRLFRSIMRKQELLADSAANLDTQEGSLAHTVDQIVQSITTPLLGELPPSPRSHNHNDHATMPHLRSSAASASSSSSSVAINAASQFASPRDYDRLAKTGLSSQQISSLAPPVTSEKIFTGTGFFFLGCFLSMIFFEPTIATCSMFFLVLGDMTAAIVGISFGSIKIGKKSLEGTVAMFAVCFTIGSIFFFNVTGSSSIVFIAALTATLVELLGPEKWWADDNITIPLSTGMAFTAAFQIVSGGVPTTMIESF